MNRKSAIGTRKSNGALSQAISLDPSTLDVRTIALACGSGAIVTFTAIVLIPVGIITFFRARRLYSAFARLACKAILRTYGITVRVHQTAPFPKTQTIYISNHTSTLDLFVLVSLGLPNCRFFLSGFLKKILPLGVISGMMGTFFTVPQDRPAERTRIFQRAERILRRTGESVYLSPEGRAHHDRSDRPLQQRRVPPRHQPASPDRAVLHRDSAGDGPRTGHRRTARRDRCPGHAGHRYEKLDPRRSGTEQGARS